MPDDSSRSPAGQGGNLWSGLRHLLFGEDAEPTLRDQIAEAIEEHEDDAPNARDLSPAERIMFQNLLDFGERTVRDVAVPRGDIIAIEEDASFDALVALFAEAGHSRLPVYRETLDTVTGMIHSFGLIAGELDAPAAITGGIAEALIATAFGLGVAILSLLPFNYLNARLEEARHEIQDAASHVELYLVKRSSNCAFETLETARV